MAVYGDLGNFGAISRPSWDTQSYLALITETCLFYSAKHLAQSNGHYGHYGHYIMVIIWHRRNPGLVFLVGGESWIKLDLKEECW